MELVPGDCAERYLAFKNTPGQQITVADIENERRRLGLDKPFVQRWGLWIVNAFRGEFGDSCILRVDINPAAGQKFYLSLGICLFADAGFAIAILVGIISAATNNPFSTTALNWSLTSASPCRTFCWR